MVKALYRVQIIHNPTLKGKPLLLLPEGLLVRWPERVPTPQIGDLVMGTAVTVPLQVRDAVMTVLFSASPLARCDAAKRLAQNKEHRRRILSRLFSASLVQKMVTSADRLDPEVRAQIEAMGDVVALRQVFKVAYAPTSRARSKTIATATHQNASNSGALDPENCT